MEEDRYSQGYEGIVFMAGAESKITSLYINELTLIFNLYCVSVISSFVLFHSWACLGFPPSPLPLLFCVLFTIRIVLMWKPLILEILLDHIYQCFPGYKFTVYYFDAEVW